MLWVEKDIDKFDGVGKSELTETATALLETKDE